MYQSDLFRDEFADLSDDEKVEVLRLLKEIEKDPHIGFRGYEAEEPTLHICSSDRFVIAYRLRQPRYTEPDQKPMPTVLTVVPRLSTANLIQQLRSRNFIR